MSDRFGSNGADGRPVWPAGPGGAAARGSAGGTVYRSSAAGGSAGMPQQPKQRPSFGQIFRLVVKYGILTASAFVIFGVVAFAVAYARTPLPNPNPESLEQSTKVYWGDNSEMGTLGSRNRTNVPLSSVPIGVQNAILAAEDPTFRENSGVSPKGIARAAINNVRGGDKQGGSTITQQYVKNVYVGAEQSYSRKAKEFMLALKVNRKLPKDEILENYLNTIYWGRSAWGIEAASLAYFNKSASKLTPAEGAYLAVLIRSPGLYSPTRKDGETSLAFQDRQKRFSFAWNDVMNKMVEHGWMSAADRATQTEPKAVEFKPNEQVFSGSNGYLYAAIRKELEDAGVDDALIDGGGLSIFTTLDKDLQNKADKTMEKNFEPLSVQDPKVHASLVSLQPGTGAVLAMYGGKDYKQVQFNAATDGYSQGGSTFKPFTLLTALKDKKVNLWDKRWNGNAPIQVPTGAGKPPILVNNAQDGPGGSYGTVDLIEATEKSINTAYVDLAGQVGYTPILDTIQALGIHRTKARGLNPEATMTLGSAAVHPIDMANAYASFAAGCKRAQKTHFIREAQTPNGTKVYVAPSSSTDVFPDLNEDDARNLCADVSYALNRVVTTPGATGSVAAGLNKPGVRQIAAKTGTSQASMSAWFVGYSPAISTAVNFYGESTDAKGNATMVSLNGVGGKKNFYGGGIPGAVWTDYMRGVFANPKYTKGEFPNSTDGLTTPPVVQQPQPAPDPGQQPSQPVPSTPGQLPSTTPSTSPSTEPSTPTTTASTEPSTPTTTASTTTKTKHTDPPPDPIDPPVPLAENP